jgi:putative membrane protein
MKKASFFATTLLTALLLSGVAFANDTAQEFVTKASIAGKFEIETSKLALEKSKNAEVKGFAQQMINDHTKADEELKATIAEGKINVKPAKELDEKHQKKLDELKKEADDFDKEYLKAQESAHEEAVSLFGDYAKDGDNASLKAFADKILPTLKAHKAHVEKLND